MLNRWIVKDIHIILNFTQLMFYSNNKLAIVLKKPNISKMNRGIIIQIQVQPEKTWLKPLGCSPYQPYLL